MEAGFEPANPKEDDLNVPHLTALLLHQKIVSGETTEINMYLYT